MGRVTCDLNSEEWCIVCNAETNASSDPISPPVFRFLSNRGKLLLEISILIWCPLRKTLLVDHKSMEYSTISPGVIKEAGFRGLRYLALIIPSVRFRANPEVSTSTSFAVKSVSRAVVEA